MQVVSNARRVSRLLQSPIFLSTHLRSTEAPIFSGLAQVKTEPLHFFASKAFYTSGVDNVEGTPTEAVKELYDKMLQSVNVKRSMPPNAWLWSMISSCKHHHDIRLLFDILQNLRRFRLSNLRIHDNFNCNLCREVTKVCVHAGALDFGKKALWKHNVYGLTPSVASAHHLLLYAKNHNDTKLLVEVMKLLKRNDLPLQPGTADIVFSICYNTDDWELINKYAKRFVKAGVKLRQTSFDTWMKFAAKRGDTESLWKIEKLRSDSMKQHTLATGFSYAKGLLLERKPSDAVAVIQVLNQTLSDAKKSGIKDELQNLVSEWPLEVLKHQKEEERKTLADSLKSDILAMVSDLLNMGLEANVNLEDLNKREDSKGLGTWVTESIAAPIRVRYVSKGRKRFYGLHYIFAPKGTPIGRDNATIFKRELHFPKTGHTPPVSGIHICIPETGVSGIQIVWKLEFPEYKFVFRKLQFPECKFFWSFRNVNLHSGNWIFLEFLECKFF